MTTTDYKDFRAFQLHDDGEKTELDIPVEGLGQHLNSENVLLLVRYDLRRIFIWKGPKSPVRKRFISSRVGSQIQEQSAALGMHLKIISVDAGEEPTEFLSGFRVQAYEVKEEEKPQDMFYIRNEERKKMEEGNTAKVANAPPAAYKSPAYSEEDIDKAMKARDKAMAAAKEKAMNQAMGMDASTPAPASASGGLAPVRVPQAAMKSMGEAEEKGILDEILKGSVPGGLKRQNIVIGTALYGPNIVIAKVFGKEVQSEKWDKINEIPEGKIDLEAGMLRVFCKNNQVLGIEVLTQPSPEEAKPKAASVEKKTEPPVKASSPTLAPAVSKPASDGTKKRELKPIPKGE